MWQGLLELGMFFGYTSGESYTSCICWWMSVCVKTSCAVWSFICMSLFLSVMPDLWKTHVTHANTPAQVGAFVADPSTASSSSSSNRTFTYGDYVMSKVSKVFPALADAAHLTQ
mmetsp:Transcript_85727/g.171614  ORF Transcript_85727/g.171614 Transcript_85727/m.171614 type:complete len:114 (-) Transcript_85727:31-372(-)